MLLNNRAGGVLKAKEPQARALKWAHRLTLGPMGPRRTNGGRAAAGGPRRKHRNTHRNNNVGSKPQYKIDLPQDGEIKSKHHK